MATNRNDDEYKPVGFYKKASEGRKRGFTSFTEGDSHYFALVVDGDVAMISQAYTSIAGRDNGIESVKKNMKLEKRYRFSENAGAHGFGLFAGNGQEIAISPGYKSKAAAEYAAGRMAGKVKAKKTVKKTVKKTAKAAAKPAKVKAVKAKAPRKSSNNEDEYRPVAFYEARSVANGFNSFEDDGEYFFGYYEKNKLVWMSESYPTKAARDVGVASVKKNKGDERKIKTIEVKNGRNYRILKAGNGKEIARSGWIAKAGVAGAGAAVAAASLAAKPKVVKPKVVKPKPKAAPKPKAVKPKVVAPIAAAALATGAIAAAKPTPKDKDDDYLPCKEYHGHTVTDRVNNVALFKHSDGQFYFAMYDGKGDVRLRSEGFRTTQQRDSELAAVLRLKDNPKSYKRIEKGEYLMDVLYDDTGREVGRSCLRKKAAPVVAAAPIAAAAAVPAAAAAVKAAPAAIAAPPVAAATGGFGWLKWLLLALLALLALFFLSKCMAKPTAAPVVVPPKAALISCWDGSEAKDQAACPTRVECWDGSFSKTLGACPAEPAPEPAPEPKAEVIATPQPAPEPVKAVLGSIDRFCGPSNVTLFNVPNYTPKSVAYLGSNPQYGDSHGLTPAQFHAKLADAASFGGKDRAFLNYMARSLGYVSFKDMDASMFSSATLNRGEKGILGFGRTHSLQYSKLDVQEERDLEAFRVRAANGQDVHFMKTCGNFMYVCQ